MMSRLPSLAILFGVYAAAQTVIDSPEPSHLKQRLREAPLSNVTKLEIEGALDNSDYVHAERMLVNEIQRLPRPVELLELAASVFFLHGEYLNAAVALKKAEAIRPLAPGDRFTLAMAYIAMKHPDWARAELVNLSRGEPKNPLYIYWQARLDYDDRRYSDAIVKLREVIAVDVKSAKGYDNLGLALEAVGKLEEATEVYSQAVRLNRETPKRSVWPPLNFGILLMKMGQTAEAEPYLREAFMYNPKSPEIAYRLGVLLERQNRLEKAIDQLQSAVALDPLYPGPHYALGRIYRRMGDEGKATQAFAKFQDLKRDVSAQRTANESSAAQQPAP